MSDWEYIKSLPAFCDWHTVVELLVLRHVEKETWKTLPPCFWLARLVAEVGELAAAIASDHEHPWELEAAQIAAIAINMLRWHGRSLDVLRQDEPKEET